jgi:hypothetical protein
VIKTRLNLETGPIIGGIKPVIRYRSAFKNVRESKKKKKKKNHPENVLKDCMKRRSHLDRISRIAFSTLK